MSSLGHKLAVISGNSRPVHYSIQEAEKYYLKFRNRAFQDTKKLENKYPNYILDYSPESLKDIEKLYFHLLSKNKYFNYSIFGLTLARMEELLAVYCGNVYVVNTNAHWAVTRDSFVANRYYLAVKSNNNALTIECTRSTFHYKTMDNKRQQYLYREFRKYEKFMN